MRNCICMPCVFIYDLCSTITNFCWVFVLFVLCDLCDCVWRCSSRKSDYISRTRTLLPATIHRVAARFERVSFRDVANDCVMCSNIYRRWGDLWPETVYSRFISSVIIDTLICNVVTHIIDRLSGQMNLSEALCLRFQGNVVRFFSTAGFQCIFDITFVSEVAIGNCTAHRHRWGVHHLCCIEGEIVVGGWSERARTLQEWSNCSNYEKLALK